MPSATSARAAISKAVADAVPCGASVCQGLVQAQSSQPSWAWCKTLPAGLPASSPASFLTKAADALPGSQSDDSRTLWPKSRIGPALTNRLHWGSVLHIAHSTTIAASNQKNTARPLGPKHASEHEHEGSLDNEELLEAVDAVRRSADSGSLYLLESRLSRVLPEHPDAATIRELIRKMEQLKQEKARLAMFRHQTPKEIRSEYLQMMLTGLFTGLAAAIHPIFFIGSVCGLVRMRRSRVAEVDRDSGTKKVEEINREIKEIRADLNSLLDGISDMASKHTHRNTRFLIIPHLYSPASSVRHGVRGCTRPSTQSGTKDATEKNDIEPRNDSYGKQGEDVPSPDGLCRKQDAYLCDSKDIANFLSVIAALVRELECSNDNIQQHVSKMRGELNCNACLQRHNTA
ncbi:uncharacterized protein LOC34617971 [Cyclospora cayetanensis]|uniref:Uncharacterized protein LOC34617971 n=1 Tax=Cyclospora cayetanensis TaxID=88456 RepID=A0A6P6RPH3_9EIME|nr:uncharacterized protein LOC34617971 [Cyclospora cayetanensis]